MTIPRLPTVPMIDNHVITVLIVKSGKPHDTVRRRYNARFARRKNIDTEMTRPGIAGILKFFANDCIVLVEELERFTAGKKKKEEEIFTESDEEVHHV